MAEQDPDMWWANAKLSLANVMARTGAKGKPLEEISMFWKKRGCR